MTSKGTQEGWVPSVRSLVPGHLVPMYLAFRYGMLFIILLLFTWEIRSSFRRIPGSLLDPYEGFVACLMLLLNHLAYFFEWRRRVAIVLRIAAALWVFFGAFYILYLSRLLYPLPVLPQ